MKTITNSDSCVWNSTVFHKDGRVEFDGDISKLPTHQRNVAMNWGIFVRLNARLGQSILSMIDLGANDGFEALFNDRITFRTFFLRDVNDGGISRIECRGRTMINFYGFPSVTGLSKLLIRKHTLDRRNVSGIVSEDILWCRDRGPTRIGPPHLRLDTMELQHRHAEDIELIKIPVGDLRRSTLEKASKRLMDKILTSRKFS